jgi:AcrR family transcriptional regulator
MGRPKKSEMGPVPTRERLLQKALELFARKGFEAVSVRDITRPLGLTEATLYIHYDNKAALLESIFERMEEKLIAPAFTPPPPEAFRGNAPVDLADVLIAGAKRFYGRTDRETLLTWRILMISQYRYESARNSLESHLLDTPRRFFVALLESLKAARKIPESTDAETAGRTIAALFFHYSFRSNLQAAGEDESPQEFERLSQDLRLVARAVQGQMPTNSHEPTG